MVHVLETRDACVTGVAAAAATAGGKSAQIDLPSREFQATQTGLALLICRARAASHARHARHATHSRNAITR